MHLNEGWTIWMGANNEFDDYTKLLHCGSVTTVYCYPIVCIRCCGWVVKFGWSMQKKQLIDWLAMLVHALQMVLDDQKTETAEPLN